MGCKSSDKAKQKYKKGLWSPDEDQKLKDYILNQGHGCWSSVPVNAGLQRNGKSCRLRWINYLRPGLKRGMFSVEEEETILALHAMLGNKWSNIAQYLPGRTDNEVKNHWHSYLKKRVTNSGEKDTKVETSGSMGNSESLQASSTPRNSPPKSNDVFEGSFTDMGQSVLQTDFPRQACRSNLPKVLFAEWLSPDQFLDKNCANMRIPNVAKSYSEYYYSDNFEDSFVPSLFYQEESFVSCSDIHPGSNGYIGDMFQRSPKFEDHVDVSEDGDFIHNMTGQFGYQQ